MKYLILILIASQVFADEPKSLTNARENINQKISKLDQQYNERLIHYLKDHVKELETLQVKYTKSGDLENALLYKEEIDSVRRFISEASKTSTKVTTVKRTTSTKGFRSVIPKNVDRLDAYLKHPDVWFEFNKPGSKKPVVIQFRDVKDTASYSQKLSKNPLTVYHRDSSKYILFWDGVTKDGSIRIFYGGQFMEGIVDSRKESISLTFNDREYATLNLVTDRERIRKYAKEQLTILAK